MNSNFMTLSKECKDYRKSIFNVFLNKRWGIKCTYAAASTKPGGPPPTTLFWHMSVNVQYFDERTWKHILQTARGVFQRTGTMYVVQHFDERTWQHICSLCVWCTLNFHTSSRLHHHTSSAKHGKSTHVILATFYHSKAHHAVACHITIDNQRRYFILTNDQHQHQNNNISKQQD